MFYLHLGYFSRCDRLEGLECESLTVETKPPVSPIVSEYKMPHKDSTTSTRRYSRYIHILVFMFSLCTAFIFFLVTPTFNSLPPLIF